MSRHILCLLIFTSFFSCKQEDPITPPVDASVVSISINGKYIGNQGIAYDIPSDSVVFQLNFSSAIDKNKIDFTKFYFSNGLDTAFAFSSSNDPTQLIFKIRKPLKKYTFYTLIMTEGLNLGINLPQTYSFSFLTQLDYAPKFPTISDDSLLTLIQKQTYKYFNDYAHPTSGLARERLNSGETVTTGGSGFGFLATLTAIHRGFISRENGFALLNKAVTFLNTKADKFHGAFPHWLNGTSGKVQPFTTKDNGGDLVETAFLMQGLLTVSEYFKAGNTQEKAMCDTIQKLWRNVEWDWYRQNGQNKLYWHWSPNYNWDMNMPITGYNEGLIIYVLAASSPTHSIPKAVYEQGWARNGALRNGNKYLDITLPLGESYGGPMFFAHYSYLCLDPRNLKDQYANYWEQNVAHAKINQKYCKKNPRNYYGYSADCWGLTASDIPNGYTASSPNNDVGVIAATAALASMPYVPTESLRAARFFYYVLGDKLWGTYGFRDAFSLRQAWFADSYLAIDQGPIVAMIENHRSGLLWNTFMQNKDIQTGLTKLGFTY
ncbi:MAG: glucoamylase family protein [Bacteroidales bacterium]